MDPREASRTEPKQPRFRITPLEERIAPSSANFPPGQVPSSNPAQGVALKEVQQFAARTGLRLVLVDAPSANDLERAFGALA